MKYAVVRGYEVCCCVRKIGGMLFWGDMRYVVRGDEVCGERVWSMLWEDEVCCYERIWGMLWEDMRYVVTSGYEVCCEGKMRLFWEDVRYVMRRYEVCCYARIWGIFLWEDRRYVVMRGYEVPVRYERFMRYGRKRLCGMLRENIIAKPSSNMYSVRPSLWSV